MRSILEQAKIWLRQPEPKIDAVTQTLKVQKLGEEISQKYA